MVRNSQEKGITLIALVVTIIILLILAGVSISIIAGENGLFAKANEAVDNYKKIAKEEAEMLNQLLSEDDIGGGETPDKTDTSEIDQKMVNQEISFQDSLATIMNPDRGWYRPVTVILGSSVDIQAQCIEAIKENIQIIHLRIDLGQFSGNVNTDGIDKDITLEQLSSLNTMVDTIRKNKLNVIIRFAYDFDGNTGKEPKSFETIKNHIRQLASFFYTNKDIISTVETGFLGPWGEMHTAGQYQSDNYYKTLIKTLLENTPSEMKINVRKPYFFKLVVGELNDSQHRLGIFNDGYLGSATDLGTFDNGISRNDFVNWMQTQGQYTLYGGEVTKSGETSDEPYSDTSFVVAEMPKTHTTYLNSQYNLSIIDSKWKNQYYTSSNLEYDGQTTYKYITDHLGYRMVVRNSKISSSVEKGDICGVNLEIENVGFGNIVKEQKVSVILRKNLEYYETTLNINVNNIRGGEKGDINFYFYVPSDIEAGEWKICLKVSSEKLSDYAIQFANPDMWDDDLLANCIGKVTIENSVAQDGIKIKQAFSTNSIEGYKGQIIEKVRTIPVTFDFCLEGGSRVTSEQLNIPLGTKINFKDASNLSSLGITIPTGYTFKYAQCNAITNDWGGYNELTIPNETSESSYLFFVYIK